jgi:hypothetical protein
VCVIVVEFTETEGIDVKPEPPEVIVNVRILPTLSIVAIVILAPLPPPPVIFNDCPTLYPKPPSVIVIDEIACDVRTATKIAPEPLIFPNVSDGIG